jgi:hypothetical protein
MMFLLLLPRKTITHFQPYIGEGNADFYGESKKKYCVRTSLDKETLLYFFLVLRHLYQLKKQERVSKHILYFFFTTFN